MSPTTEPWRRPWDPPRLAPVPDAERCPHHRGLCAYRADDPARCPRCHRSWSVITGRDGQRRRDHVNDHQRQQAHRARDRLRWRSSHEAAAVEPNSPEEPLAASISTSGRESLSRPLSRSEGSPS
jgi:hypothetical protein